VCQIQVEQERLTPEQIDTTIGGYRTAFSQTCQAITIGPRSQVDRCYIVPLVSTSFGRPDGNTFRSRRHELLQRCIAVSVERPWVGTLTGPFAVFGPHAMDTDIDTGTGLTTPWIGGKSAVALFDLASNPPERGYLDLQFYCGGVPSSLPSKRAPFEYLYRLTEFGTGGSSVFSSVYPGWGRRLTTLSIEMVGRTAGSIDWNWRGINFATHGGLTAVNIEEPLQPTVTEAADFSTTLVNDVEFDLYVWSVTENAALNAGVRVDIVVKAWD
jgi:hypothetical protein